MSLLKAQSGDERGCWAWLRNQVSMLSSREKSIIVLSATPGGHPNVRSPMSVSCFIVNSASKRFYLCLLQTSASIPVISTVYGEYHLYQRQL
ncbi:hypothetical protein J6590_073846 [Homalodisca vitripennis]|nr:hypothetical protein J6590_073846 [Homalodisca vitripennis]